MTDAISQELICSLKRKLELRQEQLRAEQQQDKYLPERAESDSQDIEASYNRELDQQVGEGLDQRHALELREIEAALKRIAAGQYGECQDCGTEIDVKRLSAFPSAKRCIECKQVFERQSGITRNT